MAEPFAERAQVSQVGQRIPAALDKQHRGRDLGEVIASLARRTTGRMKREGQKGEAAHARQWTGGLRLGGHPAAKGLAAGDQGEIGREPAGRRDRGPDGRVRDRRRIRSPGALLHERELVAQRGDAALRQPGRGRLKEPVGHARPCPMGEHVAGPGVPGPEP
jgi:hypothetical protein